MMNNIKYSTLLILAMLISSNSYTQTGPKTKIRLFDQTTVFDSVVNKNDSIYIYAGDTVFKARLSDADFYKVGTTLAPTNINDSIYTFGNVGIGTNTPTEKLHVKDGIALMNSNTDGGYLQFQYSGHSHKSEIGHISDIATGSIDWWGSNIESFDGVTQFSQPQKSLIGSASWYLQMSTLNSSSDYFSLNRIDKGNNYQEFVRVDSVGNVGIGTTVPSELLELQGGGIQLNDSMGIGFNGEIPHNSVNAGDRAKIYYNNNLFGTNVDGLVIEKTDDNNPVPDGGIAFINTGSTNVKDTALVIRGTGNVGINTPTPTNQLHIAGGTNPLRIEGLQPSIANDTAILVTNPADGTVRYLSLDSIFTPQGKLFFAAEYAGAVFDTINGTTGAHSGYMTANNGKAPDYMNYYEWYTPNATDQDYDVVLRFEVPMDFKSWSTTTIANMSEPNGNVSVEVRNVTQAVSINPLANVSNAAWTNTTLNMSTLAAAPEDVIIIVITMQSNTDDFVRAGDIKLKYNR